MILSMLAWFKTDGPNLALKGFIANSDHEISVAREKPSIGISSASDLTAKSSRPNLIARVGETVISRGITAPFDPSITF